MCSGRLGSLCLQQYIQTREWQRSLGPAVGLQEKFLEQDVTIGRRGKASCNPATGAGISGLDQLQACQGPVNKLRFGLKELIRGRARAGAGLGSPSCAEVVFQRLTTVSGAAISA